MLERLRTQIGTAGLIVAIVALVAALGGGAYAATGGNSGKATASAKQGKQGKQGKTGKTGPAGPAGAAGPAGPAGAKGETGAAGSNGKDGTNGKNGTNGEDGETGFTETLPSGKTETGIWNFTGYLTPEQEELGQEGVVQAAISFAIPLSAAVPGANIVNATKSKTECEAEAEPATCLSALAAKCPATSESNPESVRNPTAASGFLCWYTSLVVNATFVFSVPNFSKAGTTLLFSINAASASGSGSWAVTAQ